MEELTRYSDSDLAQFKELIDSKLEMANVQLQSYVDQISSASENANAKLRGLDDGASTVEREQLNVLLARQRKHIKHLQNALLRIQNKVYGVCRETNKLISKERLMAVPHATLSIEAKQKKKK